MPPSTSPVVVHKFGGAALADDAAITNVAELLSSDTTGGRRVIVTSALQGVTDQLLSAIDHATRDEGDDARSIVRTVCERHLHVARGVTGDESSPESRDSLLTRITAACEEMDDQLDALRRADSPQARFPMPSSLTASGSPPESCVPHSNDAASPASWWTPRA